MNILSSDTASARMKPLAPVTRLPKKESVAPRSTRPTLSRAADTFERVAPKKAPPPNKESLRLPNGTEVTLVGFEQFDAERKAAPAGQSQGPTDAMRRSLNKQRTSPEAMARNKKAMRALLANNPQLLETAGLAKDQDLGALSPVQMAKLSRVVANVASDRKEGSIVGIWQNDIKENGERDGYLRRFRGWIAKDSREALDKRDAARSKLQGMDRRPLSHVLSGGDQKMGVCRTDSRFSREAFDTLKAMQRKDSPDYADTQNSYLPQVANGKHSWNALMTVRRDGRVVASQLDAVDLIDYAGGQAHVRNVSRFDFSFDNQCERMKTFRHYIKHDIWTPDH